MGERWRTWQQLSCGEPFDDVHGASADGTVTVGGRAGVICSRRCRSSRDVGSTRERLEAEWQQRSASSIGEEAVVTNAHEAARQQMEQEAAQELVDRQSQQALLVGMCGVSPAEGGVALLQAGQSAVGGGDTASVAADRAQRVRVAA